MELGCGHAACITKPVYIYDEDSYRNKYMIDKTDRNFASHSI